jgi:hypothetical protein
MWWPGHPGWVLANWLGGSVHCTLQGIDRKIKEKTRKVIHPLARSNGPFFGWDAHDGLRA